MQRQGIHLDLDGAWPEEAFRLRAEPAREWGPRLRFSAPAGLIGQFYADYGSRLAPFVLYGSGDFHHLTALWVRRATETEILVSFDNHPDWDVRPPKWACGSWINRALELPHIQSVHVWGCGNFECWWPGQIFGNRRAERAGKLSVHPWADKRRPEERGRRGAILSDNWRALFQEFVNRIGDKNVYVTIDMDCLRNDEAVTNWESGRFTVDDVVWALGQLQGSTRVVGGDLCGAYSEPHYARWTQKFASEFDHPKLPRPSPDQIRRINLAALERLWPALTGA